MTSIDFSRYDRITRPLLGIIGAGVGFRAGISILEGRPGLAGDLLPFLAEPIRGLIILGAAATVGTFIGA